MTTVIKKALEIPQNELRKPKEKQIAYVLPLISTFNPNNPPVYKKEVLKRNNIPGFQNTKLINSKLQPPNLKKLLAKAELGVRKCQDLRCECCESLLLSKEYTLYI